MPPVGIYVKASQQANAELLKHELIHWQQYQRMGLLPYYFNYTKGMIMQGYDKHPMEMEARANETEFCKNNYTACVRNGTARTVSNGKFRA